MVLIFVLAILGIALLGAYVTARFVYKKVSNTSSKHPGTISVITFLVSLCLILLAAGFIIAENLSFER